MSEIRKFDSGATRDTDKDKLNYVKALSPFVLQRYVEYLKKHRQQPNGDIRDWDNWKKGIPKQTYIESLIRHNITVWLLHEGYLAFDNHGKVDIEDALCAIIFNASGCLYEILKPQYEKQIQNPSHNDSNFCSKITRVYLDMDDVLVDLTSAVCEKLDKPYYSLNFSGNYSLEKVLNLPCKSGEIWKHYEYTFDENFWANLSFTTDAFDIIDAVKKIIGIENIYLLSRPTGIKGCLEGKRRWLIKNLSSFSDKAIFIHDKSSITTPNFLLVDDSDEQINNWRAAGGQAILYPRPWNSRWKETDIALNIFQKELKKYGVWCPQTTNISP